MDDFSPEQVGLHSAAILRSTAAAAEKIREEAEHEAERIRAGANEQAETARAHAAATIQEARTEAAAIIAGARSEAARLVQDGEQLLDDACRRADDRLAEAEQANIVAEERKAAADRALDDAQAVARNAIEEGRRRGAELLEAARGEAAALLADAHRTADRLVEDARWRASAEQRDADEARAMIDGMIQQLRHLQKDLGFEQSAEEQPLDVAEEHDEGEVHLIALRRADHAHEA